MAAIARPESTKSTPDRNPEPTPHAALDLEPDSKTLRPGKRSPIRLRVAWKALGRLIENPDRTDQVFVIIDALSGKSGERQFLKFAATAVGRRILADQRDLLAVLSNREALHAMPQGSLGNTYANFMSREAISADGLVEASNEGGRAVGDDAQRTLFGVRLRDSHDLWHVATGYGRDLVGEASLLAFTFAQTRNPGIGVIVAMAYLKAGNLPGARPMIRKAYRRGRKSAWLPTADWEALLALPLDAVREELKLGVAPEYFEVRSDEGAKALGSS
jgi:ubiquinone biosynthesis protein COQ4